MNILEMLFKSNWEMLSEDKVRTLGGNAGMMFVSRPGPDSYFLADLSLGTIEFISRTGAYKIWTISEGAHEGGGLIHQTLFTSHFSETKH